MKIRTLLTLALAVAVAPAGTVWIKSFEPTTSPSGSLEFLSAATELPIFDRAGKKTNWSSQQFRSRLEQMLAS
jgi:hypothetical protein